GVAGRNRICWDWGGFFGGDGSDAQGKNNKLWDLNCGQEERGFARPGGAKARWHRGGGAGGAHPHRGPRWRGGLGRRGCAPRRTPRARAGFAGLGRSSLGEGGGRERGRAPPARRGAGSRGAGGGRRQLRRGGATRAGGGRGGPGPGGAGGTAGVTARGGRCGGGQPAGRLRGGAAPAPPPPPPSAIQRASAAVSTGSCLATAWVGSLWCTTGMCSCQQQPSP
ncbi:unnamed protein product, partial [Bubo scandiacus]